MRAHWALRFAVLLAATIMLGENPVQWLVAAGSVASATGVTGFQLLDVVLVGLQLAVLALFWGWAIWITVSERSRRMGPVPAPQRFRLVEFLGCLGLLGIYSIAYLAGYLSYLPVDRNAVGLLLVGGLSLQYLFIFALLPLIVFWASTDFAEWGQLFSRQVMHTTRRWTWLLVMVACVAALAVIVNVWRQVGIAILPVLLLMCVLAGLLILLARFAGVGDGWGESVSPGALLVGTVLLYAFLSVPLLVAPVGLAIGIALIARGRRKRSIKAAEIGLFATAVGVLLVLEVVAMITKSSMHLLFGEQMLVALAIFGFVFWHAVRRGLSAIDTRPVVLLFVLLGALQFIVWMADFYSLKLETRVVEAIVLLLAIAWDVTTSGETTNEESPGFPRHSRVLLYFGYTVMAAFAVLYLTSLHAQGIALPSGESLDDSLYAEVGLLGLGIAFVTVSFIRGWRLWRLGERSQQT